MINVRDIMNRGVVTVNENETVTGAIQFMTKNHVGGAPVVNERGTVVGIVSELALLDVVFDRKVRDASISAYMTNDVHTVQPDESLSRVAQLFALYSFRRVPVVENGKLVGIVTRRDLMNYALAHDHVLADPLLELVPSLAS